MNRAGKKMIEQWVTPIGEGIWQIELPQMESQTANVFLIEDETLTLIDSGPPYDNCLEVLHEGLRFLGYKWADIDLLILTHPHIDHIGGAAFLPDPPQVYAYQETMAEIGSYDQYIDRWMKLPHLLASEYPDLRGIFLSQLSLDWFEGFFPRGGSLQITRELVDEERISLGKRELEVIYTPGHSMKHVGLLLKQEKLFFSGDYMLQRGPALTRLMGDQVDAFVQSIKRVEQLDIDRVLPSHGHPFSFETGLQKVAELVSRQEEKLKRVLSDSPKTAIDLFIAYFGMKNASLERVGIEFTGVDTFIKHLLKDEMIKQEGLHYFLND
ncbi:MBL fold metallo-hydrolase [Peribacillus cavernae]|uniref:MBL fold metallo-hydrolase n=1 Tax=Peribacillus cavernae TaxID=1674310 RepID=A0A433HWN6_9BACI|nr:MBL fold metallo-hydrolase [Peribacillus cavernae]MDQ0218101.1 glyoxylase-like metal-dependent hydrolase (beta-lactamase superfamily II) [Peribacillus cavernae]RUQ32742.1 MBL fold metallo-hydrolase [Peribacillus cavernae]